MKLTWGQWFQLAIFGLGWKKRHQAAIDEGVDGVLRIIAPKMPDPEGAISHEQAADKIRNGTITEAERLQLERASRPDSGGVG